MISVLRRYFSQHWLPVTISQQYWTDRATLQVRSNLCIWYMLYKKGQDFDFISPFLPLFFDL